MRFLYKYPQAAFPYARAGRGEPPARRGSAGVRAGRHRRLRREPLLRRRGRVRQGGRRRHPDPHPRHQPRAGDGAARRACRRSGSATRGRGPQDAARPSLDARRQDGTRPSRSTSRQYGAPMAALRRRSAGAAVHRERDQYERLFGVAERSPLLEGRVPPLRRRRRRATRSIRREHGTKAAAHYALDAAGRRDASRCGCA